MTDFHAVGIVLAAYGFAGFVKGTVGLGLPTVTLALLVPSIGLAPAVALTVVPTFVTNAWQALSGGHFRVIVRRLWPLLLTATIGTLVGTGLLAALDPGKLSLLLGTLLVLYGAYGLVAPPLPAPGRLEALLSPLVGFVAGVMAGMVGAFLMPGIIYLQALRLPREELIQTLGIIFFVLSIALGSGLASNNLLPRDLVALSAVSVLPALAGMELGRRFRRHLSEQRFRKVFFCALIALGANIAWRGLQ
ncbi:MAG: sulfite exporter TauE/SafE family protein [Pseudomonadota bacterium]